MEKIHMYMVVDNVDAILYGEYRSGNENLGLFSSEAEANEFIKSCANDAKEKWGENYKDGAPSDVDTDEPLKWFTEDNLKGEYVKIYTICIDRLRECEVHSLTIEEFAVNKPKEKHEPNLHYNTSLDTYAVITNDDSEAVALCFTDKETDEIDIYPIPVEIAKDLGQEIIHLAESFEEKA